MNDGRAQTTLGEAQEAIASLPNAVEYAQVLDPAQWYAVQHRCAGTQAQREVQQTSRNDHAIRVADAWTQDTTQCTDNATSDSLMPEPGREWLASIPRSFRLSEYVESAHDMADLHSYGNLQTYGRQIPAGDQDVVGKQGVRILEWQVPIYSLSHKSLQLATPPAEPKQSDMVLHVSVYSRQHLNLTRKTRFGADLGDTQYDAPNAHAIDGDFVHTQTIECSLDTTLDEFAREVVCRNTEIPKRTNDADMQDALPMHWTGMEDEGIGTDAIYPDYTGAQLHTDVCALVGNRLYGRLDPDTRPDESYVQALLQSVHALPLPPGTHSAGRTLGATRFSDLTDTTLGTHHWLLHTGDCEHYWCIDWTSMRKGGTGAGFPRTVFLRRWALSSLARQYLVPRRLMQQRGSDRVACDVCQGMRDAEAVVLGGDRVHMPSGRLQGMAQLVTPCCAVCYQAAAGEALQFPAGGKPGWSVMPLFYK